MKAVSLVGRTFGRWTVLARAPKNRSLATKEPVWRCRCACGVERDVVGGGLKGGVSKSCGCLRADVTTANNTTHGKTGTPEHRIWKGMQGRCNTPTHSRFAYYGGRGIRVCARWTSFEAFLDDMGTLPTPRHSIDRIDPNGNYEPSNCRWATPSEQAKNKRPRKTEAA